MDNISIAENNNLHIQEIPNARVQGDPNVFINSDVVQIGDDITIQIGSTETLPPDSLSYVHNSGDDKNIILNFGLVRGQNGRDGIDGIDGLNGRDGFSPSATVTQTETGASISITDVNGTTTANVTNGTDGTDGFSPIANVTGTNYGAEISITDKNGTTTAQVVDGYSPIANVTPTATGATISITDVNGTTTANIDNGVNGADGVTPNISATASVDSTTGTPSVTVTKSGSDANPSFAFAFQHLKGEDGTTPTLETVNLSRYVTAKSGFTFTDNGCRRFGKIVILNFTVSGTIGTGETNVGDCTNVFNIDFFGAGRTAAWQQTNRPANIMMIPNGSARIYSVANNTSADFTVILFEN